MKVGVFQCPCNKVSISRSPRARRPRVRTMLVLTQVNADPGSAAGNLVAGRAGPIALNPRVYQHVAWLEALVWPRQPERLEHLRAAIATARSGTVRVMKGDPVDGLASVVDQAPRGPTPVVFHSAVLA
jgi:hypothetical protein